MVHTCGYVGSEMLACHGAYSEEFGCISASGVLKLSLHMHGFVYFSIHICVFYNVESSLSQSVFLSSRKCCNAK